MFIVWHCNTGSWQETNKVFMGRQISPALALTGLFSLMNYPPQSRSTIYSSQRNLVIASNLRNRKIDEMKRWIICVLGLGCTCQQGRLSMSWPHPLWNRLIFTWLAIHICCHHKYIWVHLSLQFMPAYITIVWKWLIFSCDSSFMGVTICVFSSTELAGSREESQSRLIMITMTRMALWLRHSAGKKQRIRPKKEDPRKEAETIQGKWNFLSVFLLQNTIRSPLPRNNTLKCKYLIRLRFVPVLFFASHIKDYKNQKTKALYAGSCQ